LVERYGALSEQARATLDAEGFPARVQRFARSADLRYFGQAFEVRVDLPDGPLDRACVEAVADRFHREHHRLYGYDFRHDAGQQLEWVNFRVSGIGPISKPAVGKLGPRSAGSPVRRPGSRRKVRFDVWVDAEIVDRSGLDAGATVNGPAVIEEFSSTVPVDPGFLATVDDFGNLLLHRAG
jgi:N-methylhydantoinase A